MKLQGTKDLQEFRKSTVTLENGKILAVHNFELIEYPECDDKCLKLVIDNISYGIQYLDGRDLGEADNDEFAEYWKVKPFKARYKGHGCLTQRITPYFAENGLYDEDGNWIPCFDFSIYQLNSDWVLEIIAAPESFEYKEVNG